MAEERTSRARLGIRGGPAAIIGPQKRGPEQNSDPLHFEIHSDLK